MTHNRIFFYISLLSFFSSLYLLITGSSLLTYTLDKDGSIPLGTFITWGGIISLPLTLYLGLKKLQKPIIRLHYYLSILLKVTILLSFLWAPISYLLAGNISFSFTEKETFKGGQLAMEIFWNFTYLLPILSILLLITYFVHHCSYKSKRK